MSFPPTVAPIKVLLVPLVKDARFQPVLQQLSDALDAAGVAFRVDPSGVSIGKRYARNDELGIPLGVTVDHASLEDGSVTLRERDSTRQVRGAVAVVVDAVTQVVQGRETWEDVRKRLPEFVAEGREE